MQHAHNPVDWYPWSEEAFERARAEQKPIIVSIGYSTCHWCHVMERESFENPQVAEIMNRHYINIKVDREERPDVDAIYMEACQIMTGGGGWPLNCFLTPEGKPFYAGTYFPPVPAHNRPSWTDLLMYLADIWAEKRETALEQADRLTGYVRKDAPPVITPPGGVNPEAAQLKAVFERIKSQFDYGSGGFGGAPKFPSSMAIRFLMEYAWHERDMEALQHALFSLEKMISGGIYDQIGGGFARYATDRDWNIPHFEKMLYDNALLLVALADAYKIVRKNPDDRFAVMFRDTIEETLGYVAREMTNPEGGFYSAQDADSEGVEGKFYVWEKAEIEELLGAASAEFCEFYSVETGGNWEHVNILFRNGGVVEQTPWIHRKLKPQRDVLLKHRSARIWPLLDTKVLLDWNALMCSAHAAAFTALGHEAYRQAAIRNVAFILKHLRRPADGTETAPALKHSMTQSVAFLDDYAFFIAALLDVFEVTFDRQYLDLADQYTQKALEMFFDAEQGVFYFTGKEQTDILARKKDFYDNATPSGNSTMVHNLQRLSLLFDRPEWMQTADTMLAVMQASYTQFPQSFANWAQAWLHQQKPAAEIAVVGADAFEKALALQADYLPNKIIVASANPDETIPLLSGKAGNSESMIYLCHNYTCQKPVVSLENFWEML